MTTKTRKLLLHACPRCHGDLLYDTQDEEFVCMQCSRHVAPAMIAELLVPKSIDEAPKEPVAA